MSRKFIIVLICHHKPLGQTIIWFLIILLYCTPSLVVYIPDGGHAVAQAVSFQLATTMDQVWSWVRSCAICGGQSGTGAGFLWVLLFVVPNSHLSFWAGTIGQLVANIRSGLSLTSSHEKKNMFLAWEIQTRQLGSSLHQPDTAVYIT
jgi:hypothetical protein